MSDERKPQEPQDELSEDQLSEVSGGVGDPHQPGANPAPSDEEKKKKPVEQQQYMQIELENVQITSYQLN